MTLLILGGTKDARIMADSLIASNIKVIYSIKGLVRQPDLHCDIQVGGFSQSGGLTAFIQRMGISAILDATHPYASRMTAQALAACESCRIPCWVFHRKPWVARENDQWVMSAGWDQVAIQLSEAQLSEASRIFLSAGQLPSKFLRLMHEALSERFFLLRTAVKPNAVLPDNVHWIKAIGPFTKDHEKQLLTTFSIDTVVSKNSGGSSTYAKIEAARELSIPVIMLQRPTVPENAMVMSSRAACLEHCIHYYGDAKGKKLLQDRS